MNSEKSKNTQKKSSAGQETAISTSSLTVELEAVTPLDRPKRLQSGNTCHRPHRLNDFATESGKWNGKPRLASDGVPHPPSKIPAEVPS